MISLKDICVNYIIDNNIYYSEDILIKDCINYIENKKYVLKNEKYVREKIKNFAIGYLTLKNTILILEGKDPIKNIN